MSTRQVYDPERLAIDVVLRLDEVIKKSSEGGCDALARRAKEAPQLLVQAGLTQLLLFYLSKSDDELLKQLTGVLRGSGGVDKGKLSEECKGEGKGYTLATAILAEALHALSEQGLLEAAGDACRDARDVKSIAGCIKALREHRMEIRAELLLEPYLIAVKRLAEALYEEKEKKGERR